VVVGGIAGFIIGQDDNIDRRREVAAHTFACCVFKFCLRLVGGFRFVEFFHHMLDTGFLQLLDLGLVADHQEFPGLLVA